jgi:hypothetical protein
MGGLFLFVLPGRAYLAQRRELTAAETRVSVLGKANTELNQQITSLQTDAEIERRARQFYGMKMPNETQYAILPSAAPATPASSPAPAKKAHRGLPARLWRDLQFWR